MGASSQGEYSDSFALLLREQMQQSQGAGSGGGSQAAYYRALLQELEGEAPNFGGGNFPGAPPLARGMGSAAQQMPSQEYLLMQAFINERREPNASRVVSDDALRSSTGGPNPFGSPSQRGRL